MTLPPGEVRLRGVSRSFRIVHERNETLKETLLRRRRTSATDRWALREVDLDIAAGEAVGVIGQNGSGKSTLLKLVAGILHPQQGRVETAGTVASMLELGAGFHPDFTGRENVFMNGAILGMSEREVASRFDEIVAFSELDEFIDMPVKTYSSGMQMRLAFAVASHVDPDILLLDEVLAVGDEAFQQKCFGRIFDFQRRGGTLIFVSHDPGAIERVCDRVLLIIDGVVTADGPPKEVLAEYHRRLADAQHGDTAAGSREQGSEWGNRQVTVERISLLGADGETDSFLAGDPFAVEIDCVAHRATDTPIVGIAVHFIDGPLCYGTNTRIDGLPIEQLHGTARVRFSCNALPLHSGRFVLTVAVHSHDEDVVYHWLDRCMEFSVFPRMTGEGPVDLSGTWTLQARASRSETGPPEEPLLTHPSSLGPPAAPG